MQAIKLRIPGRYWDSQIYSGKLYLFSRDHEIVVYDWRQTITLLTEKYPSLQTGLRIGLLNGELLYNPQVRSLLVDDAVRSPIFTQLVAAGGVEDLELSFRESLKGAKKRTNPFPAPHADSEIYYSRLYVGLKDGCFSTNVTSETTSNASSAARHWDGPVFNIKASRLYTTLAIAAGEEGLREFSLKNESHTPFQNSPTKIAKRICTACDWSFQSVYGWSYDSGGFLASFKKTEDRRTKRLERVFDRVVSSEKIFSSGGLSWGAQDKIYALEDGAISVSLYNPKGTTDQIDQSKKNSKTKSSFNLKGSHATDFSAADVVAVATAMFGTIVETHDALIVLRSDENVEKIEGEPVNWRIFPRSENYTNQLHIVYDDHIEIRAYLHDFFVDQDEKWAGTSKSM